MYKSLDTDKIEENEQLQLNQKFDSVLFCCPQMFGCKTHLKITTDLELSSRLSLIKCCAILSETLWY